MQWWSTKFCRDKIDKLKSSVRRWLSEQKCLPSRLVTWIKFPGPTWLKERKGSHSCSLISIYISWKSEKLDKRIPHEIKKNHYFEGPPYSTQEKNQSSTEMWCSTKSNDQFHWLDRSSTVLFRDVPEKVSVTVWWSAIVRLIAIDSFLNLAKSIISGRVNH